MSKRRSPSCSNSSVSAKQAFRKFKLVAFDDNDNDDSDKNMLRKTQKIANMEKLEQHLRNYDPRMRAMANSYEGMQDALFNKKVRRTSNQRLNIYNANRSRFHQMSRNRPEVLMDALPQQQQEGPLLNPAKEEEEEEADDQRDLVFKEQDGKEEEEEEEEVEYKSMMSKPRFDDIAVAAVPKNYQAKLRNLINLTSNKIMANERGEVVINGQELADTSLSDVMRALYVNRKGFVSGLAEVVDELKRSGVSPGLLSSSRAKSLYAKSRVGKLQSGSGCKARRVLRLY